MKTRTPLKQSCSWLSLALAPLLALIVLSISGASALAARGHVFGGTFGSPGSGKGQFDKPAGVAVNEATGDVYVVDEGNDRVERFSAAGDFLGQFDGSGSYEVEGTEHVGDKPSTGKFAEPWMVAVDNACVQQRPKLTGSACTAFDPSNGDVYVADGVPHKVVDKFEPEGKFVGQIEIPASPQTPENLRGVAVDSHGDLWVAENEVETGHYGFARFSNAVANEYLGFVGDGGLKLAHGLAVDSEESLYPGRQFGAPIEQVIAKFGTEEELINGQHERVLLSGALEQETSSGVASELPSNDVYINNLSTVARLDPAGILVERFGEGHLPSASDIEAFEPIGDYASGVAVDGASREGQVYVPDAVSNNVAVFPLEPPGPPTVEGVSVSDVTATSATLQAEVNPRGALSEYHVEYGECPSVASCVGAPFERVVPEPDAATGAPFDFETQQVGIHPQDLAPATTYHFRFRAHNEKNVPGTVVTGPEDSFTTQPVAPFELPDGRAWELVSPAQKHGALLSPITEQGVIQAAVSGGALTYFADSPTESQPQGYTNLVQVLSRRTATGWASEDLPVAHARATGASIGEGEEYRLFSPDLSLGVLQPFGPFEPSTSPQASEQTPYLRTNFTGGSVEAPCTGGCYRPLVTAGNAREGARFGEEGKCPPELLCGPRVVGASPDVQHVVMRSKVGLTSTEGDEGGLYEWTAGGLTLVSVLPDGKPAPPAVAPALGGGGLTRNAVSADGTRVVWSEASGQQHLYVRNVTGEETVELDKGLTGVPEFQTASTDGSRVFFTDGGDLYVYEVESGEALRLTTPVEAGERTDVRNPIVGASEDGSYVYFVANSRLTEVGAPVNGNCDTGDAPSTKQCNLYELHETGGVWGTPKLVAVLSGEDVPESLPLLRILTARVSPDGRFLAFMSDRSLTGYDNSDAVSAKPDEEVFLYDANTGHLSCASCNPTGARPTGVEYKQLENESGLVAGFRVWPASTWLAANIPGWTPYNVVEAFYQSRYLSNSGRLFFNSSDALSPQDTNGTEDVYEFEPAGIGNCRETSLSFSARSGGCVDLISAGTSRGESAFLDASESGDDVFFLTSSRLSGKDFDTALDVYDAHVCTASAPCLAEAALPPLCTTEAACKAPPTPQPEIFGAPASATFSGLGNILPVAPPASKPRAKPLTRAQLLAKALGVCRRRHPHSTKHRRSCERNARNRYAHTTGVNDKESKR